MKALSSSIVLTSVLVLLAAIIYAKSSHKSGLSLEPVAGNPYNLSDIGGVIETPGPVPSIDSVKRLLEVMGARENVSETMKRVESMVEAARQQLITKEQFNAADVAALNELNAKQLEMVSNELNWERLEPLCIKAYQNSLTQQSVDDLTIVYRSEVGWLLRSAGKDAGKKLDTALQPILTSVMLQGEQMTEKYLLHASTQASGTTTNYNLSNDR